MRILFFGRYDSSYSRNAVLLQGLRLNHVDVSQCAVVPSARFWPIRLLWRYFRMRPAFDVMVVAFPGQEVMPLARLLTRKPIIFDAFTSHYEGYVEDRKTVAPSSFHARWYAFLDRLSCRLATAVLTDTNEHAKYFAQRFRVPVEKLHTVLLGTEMPGSSVGQSPNDFIVHFHATNIPLQGIDIIWGAIRRLWNKQIRFQIVGPIAVPAELVSHVDFTEQVPFQELSPKMARSHVCLGIFGTTPKTQRVIPNKVYEALAVSKPVITADTSAVRELLDGSSALLIPAGDPDALASAILRLKDDTRLRDRIARAGHEALLRSASTNLLGSQVVEIAHRIL